MKSIDIIFAGTPDFAVPALLALISNPHINVKAVISQPDKPVGRKKEVLATPVKAAAQSAGIPVLQPQNINTDYPEMSHDYLVVVAYGQILRQPILDAPRKAALNLHASLLPRWRGASPMQHTLLHGDTETGVTVQRMVKALDAGPILSQSAYTVTPRETIQTLHDTLAEMGAKLLEETLLSPPEEYAQDESEVTLCHKLTRAMGDVDPSTMTATEIDRHVRALVPWPGVRCSIQGQMVKLLETRLEPNADSIPLTCKNSIVHVVSVQPPGKRKMSGADFMRGRE